jgi:hypothetical protein
VSPYDNMSANILSFYKYGLMPRKGIPAFLHFCN